MIYAWDNYPVRQFPGLWRWIAVQVTEKQMVMPVVAFEEVFHKTKECGAWLKDNNLQKLEIGNAIIHDAMRIKGLIGVINDNFRGGVGENDLLIIATARIHHAELVSDEARQLKLPELRAKYKIPAVCAMAEVDISCINFIEYIKRSNEVFC
jgi:predicted nucleic acid-binding protein